MAIAASPPGSGASNRSIASCRHLSAAASVKARAKGSRIGDLENKLASVKGLLEVTLSNVDQGIVMIDADHYVRLYNKRFVDILAIPKRVLTEPLHFSQILEYQWSVGEFSGTSDDIVAWIRAGGIFKSPPVYERLRPDGTVLEIRTTLLADGGAVRTFADVTERSLKEQALRQAEHEYRGLFENAVVGIYRSTMAGRMLRANPALVALNGYTSEAELLASVENIAGEWYVEPNRRAEFLRQLQRDGRVTDFVSEVYRHKTRERIWVSEAGWHVRGENGEPDLIEGTIVDASERMQAQTRIAHMARHDALTGLPNRSFLSEGIEAALADEGHKPFAVHYLDLDRFKEVNDTLGHAAGDTLLQLAGRRLRKCVRDGDIVARLGGDEFAVIQFDTVKAEEVENLAARIVRSLSAPYKLGEHRADVGVSVGIALAPDDGDDVQELIKNADIALYQAKAEGRKTHRRFDHRIEAGLRERRRLEADLHGALAKGQFAVEYQPIVSTLSGAVEGYEALLRWRHPRRGVVSPSVFIPLAEEFGIIDSIGEWILREACAQAARLPGAPFIAVNLSPFQLRGGGFTKTVMSALVAAALPANRLMLEITESVLLSDDRSTKEALVRLRQAGVQLALDDFGTGHSSLHYLQKFQFDKIKIDRSFIATFDKDRASGALVRAVINLCRDLDIPVIAEGVETKAQLDNLAKQGCQSVQGYLLGRPAPIEQWLGAAKRRDTGALATPLRPHSAKAPVRIERPSATRRAHR